MLYLVIVDGQVVAAGDDRQEALDAGHEEISGQKGARFLLVTLRDSSHEEIGHAQEEETPAAKKGGKR